MRMNARTGAIALMASQSFRWTGPVAVPARQSPQDAPPAPPPATTAPAVVDSPPVILAPARLASPDLGVWRHRPSVAARLSAWFAAQNAGVAS